jgi:predicted  nucleic acid-binding Zn-ribbon protein
MKETIELLRCRTCGYEFTYIPEKMERKCKKCKNTSLRKINYNKNKSPRANSAYHDAFNSDDNVNNMQYDCYGNPLSRDSEDKYSDQDNTWHGD